MSIKTAWPPKTQGPRTPASGRPAQPQPRAAANAARPAHAAPAATRGPQAPPAYRPQPVPKVLQTKQPPGRSPAAPPAPKPQATPYARPSQSLPQASRPASSNTQRAAPSAPPVYRPAPNAGVQRKEATAPRHAPPPAPSPFFPRVIQRMEDDAEHNWDNVVAQYNNRSAGKEVETAFMENGFYGEALREAILRAMRETGYGNKRIAHGLGNQGSKKRGGTDTKIQACKEALIQWAEKYSLVEKKPVKKGKERKVNRKGKGGNEDEDGGGEGT